MRNILNNKSGYTFFELVVVLTIFSLLSSIVAGIFILFSKAQVRTITSQNLITDARYILEVMVRGVRNNRIDYDAYTLPFSSPMSELYLKDKEGNPLVFRIVQDNCAPLVDSCLEITRQGVSAVISSSDTNIKNLKFYIYPSDNPFSFNQGIFASDAQPGVTISLSAESVNGGGDTRVDIDLQTTVSSKQYLR